MAKKDKTKSSGGSSFGFYLTAATVTIVMAVLFREGFIFFVLGMLPAVVAFLIDGNRSKPAFKTVAAFNFSGIFPFMIQLWNQGNTSSAVQDMLGNVFVWFAVYFTAAAGWALYWATPLIARGIMDWFYRNHIASLEDAQKKLIEEWGPEVQSGG